MREQHRATAQAVGRGADIVDVVRDGTCVKSLRGRAGAVSAQAQGDRAITRIGKEVQKVAPARRGMPTTVNEQQRYRMRFAVRPLVYHLEQELIITRLGWAACLNRCPTG